MSSVYLLQDFILKGQDPVSSLSCYVTIFYKANFETIISASVLQSFFWSIASGLYCMDGC